MNNELELNFRITAHAKRFIYSITSFLFSIDIYVIIMRNIVVSNIEFKGLV